MSAAALLELDLQVAGVSVETQTHRPVLDPSQLSAELVFGERGVHACAPEMEALRRSCGQEDDITTDPLYFLANNRLSGRRPVVVTLRRPDGELEACVLFFEHCRFGLGLGLLRGGDGIGGGLTIGPAKLQLHYVHLATQAALRHWRIHGVSLAVLAPAEECVTIMRGGDARRMFSARSVAHRFPLGDNYQALLARLGPRTRRSLAGKRQKLEKEKQIAFLPSLTPDQALTAMLSLQSRSTPRRDAPFYRARFGLLCDRPDFFTMGLQLADGTWLSVLSGWRRKGLTYIDLQMNDSYLKKESLSAVMRSFMLEHEIARHQDSIDFVGGTSMLLRRYCRPLEPASYAFVWKPCLRASIARSLISRMKAQSVYERVRPGVERGWPTPSSGQAKWS
jgi:hypothetical protein